MTESITRTSNEQVSALIADYLNLRKHEGSSATEKDFKRFAAKVEILDNGCWLWTGSSNDPTPANPYTAAYGRFLYQGKLWLAHRWVWEQVNGEVPSGLVLDHFLVPAGECVGPQCVNPEHLEPVTTRENILRGNGITARNARKTHCPRGHEYTGKDKRGWRICLTCRKARTSEDQKVEVAA